jgi:hypothetical protein
MHTLAYRASRAAAERHYDKARAIGLVNEARGTDGQMMRFPEVAQVQNADLNIPQPANYRANVVQPERFVCFAKTGQLKHGVSTP